MSTAHRQSPKSASTRTVIVCSHILSCPGQGWAVGDPCTENCVLNMLELVSLEEGRRRNPFEWLSLVVKTVQGHVESLENTGKV